MHIISRFGVGDAAYTFNAAHQITYEDNFATLQPEAVRLPGMPGGYDAFGTDAAPSAVGEVVIALWLYGTDAADLGDKLVALRRMATMGRSKLFMTHTSGKALWTDARVIQIEAPQDARQMAHVRQRVEITFQVPGARWYAVGDLLFLDDITLDDGEVLGMDVLDRIAIGAPISLNVTHDGNAPAAAFILWEAASGNITNPTIYRENASGQRVDEVTWQGTVSGTMYLGINARTYTVSDSYANLSTLSAAWLQIPPGFTKLYVEGTLTASVWLTIEFYETYV